MRISESKLRKIIRTIIAEQTVETPANQWISLDDIQRLIDEDEKVNNTFWDSVDSRSTSELMEILPEKLGEDQAVKDKFYSQYGAGRSEDEVEPMFIDGLMKWFTANERNIERFLQKSLDDAYDPVPSDDTERIFGSEAGYWRYRMG